jgi:hypothetical protein
MTMERLTDLLFENSESIPNGLYLTLMNELRDMHRAKEPAAAAARIAGQLPPPTWLDFRTMWFSPPDLRMLSVGDVLEILDGKGMKTFYKVKKIKDMQIEVDIWRVHVAVQDAQTTRFKFKQETTLGVKKSYKQMQQLYFRHEHSRDMYEKLRTAIMGYIPMARLAEFEFSLIELWVPPHLE